MNTEEKILRLVQRLYAKTMNGETLWEKTSGKGVFQIAFPNYIVKLSTRPNDDSPDTPDYVVSILDESGTVIERASDVELKQLSGDVKIFQIMEDLYKKARRTALGVDTALDSLLSELDKNSPF